MLEASCTMNRKTGSDPIAISKNKSNVDQTAPIHVARSVVPDLNEYTAYITNIISTHHLTNNGIYVRELEKKLCAYLDISHLSLCTNGTMSLQIALRALGLQGHEVITTPFTYVATTSALLWEQCTPVFIDIDPETLCLDPGLLASAPCDNPEGILPVHVYGNACDVDSINNFAVDNNLKVLYDAAQAFGCNYQGKSLFNYGDLAIASFHATKIFHTVEGGAIISHSGEIEKQIKLLRAYGHIADTHISLGINAKMTEPHAAMGLCLLPTIHEIIAQRKRISAIYDSLLPTHGVRKPQLREGMAYNYAYYPLIFDNEKTTLNILQKLNAQNIFPRRYFYPSLTTLPYLSKKQHCPIADSISTRVLALPLYEDLPEQVMEHIMHVISSSV